MPLYQYIKEAPVIPETPHKKRGKSRFMISALFLFSGLVIIGWVVHPIVSFELTSRYKYSEDNSETSSPVLGMKTVSDTSVNYQEASNWIPSSHTKSGISAGRIYFLSIPKLRITDALVKIAGEDLNKTLVHYGGTGLPGDYGTAVIFGHSILPQFYDPKNYKTIFSLLPKLEKGDEIFIKYDGISYRYVVGEMRVTTPEDLTVLEQRYDNSYISLVTCVPPGTYWKRLLIRARLTPS